MYLISLPKGCFRTRTLPLTWEIRKSLPSVKSKRAKRLLNHCLRYEFSSSYLGIWQYVQRLDESLHSKNINESFNFELLLIRKNSLLPHLSQQELHKLRDGPLSELSVFYQHKTTRSNPTL